MGTERVAVIILMGVAGAGKTTVGVRLAAALGWSFLDGDALHPSSNVDKMRRGIALTDADRAPWLERLRGAIEHYLAMGEPAVIACSALRRSYRAFLRTDPRIRFVYLRGAEPLLRARLAARRGHYAGEALLASQLAALEEPRAALVLDAGLPVDALVERIVQRWHLDEDRNR